MGLGWYTTGPKLRNAYDNVQSSPYTNTALTGVGTFMGLNGLGAEVSEAYKTANTASALGKLAPAAKAAFVGGTKIGNAALGGMGLAYMGSLALNGMGGLSKGVSNMIDNYAAGNETFTPNALKDAWYDENSYVKGYPKWVDENTPLHKYAPHKGMMEDMIDYVLQNQNQKNYDKYYYRDKDGFVRHVMDKTADGEGSLVYEGGMGSDFKELMGFEMFNHAASNVVDKAQWLKENGGMLKDYAALSVPTASYLSSVAAPITMGATGATAGLGTLYGMYARTQDPTLAYDDVEYRSDDATNNYLDKVKFDQDYAYDDY